MLYLIFLPVKFCRIMTNKKYIHVPVQMERLVKHEFASLINLANRFMTLGSTTIIRITFFFALATPHDPHTHALLIHTNLFNLLIQISILPQRLIMLKNNIVKAYFTLNPIMLCTLILQKLLLDIFPLIFIGFLRICKKTSNTIFSSSP